jgi:hypothetical protein
MTLLALAFSTGMLCGVSACGWRSRILRRHAEAERMAVLRRRAEVQRVRVLRTLAAHGSPTARQRLREEGLL